VEVISTQNAVITRVQSIGNVTCEMSAMQGLFLKMDHGSKLKDGKAESIKVIFLILTGIQLIKR
jgi:hypothetical protein